MVQMVQRGLLATMGSPAWLRANNTPLARLSFSLSPAIDKNIRNEMVSQIKLREDSVSISDTGMRLLIDGKKPEESWERVTAGGVVNEKSKVADKFISIAGKLLEQMKEIAASAVDNSLDDEARIKKQIEIGRLQHQMNTETIVTGGLLAGKSEGESRAFAGDAEGSFFQTEPYKMLERAYERIIGGGDGWDVAELYVPIVEHHPFLPEKWESEYVWEVTDNADVPTVGEILKTTGRSVMDPKAAVVSVKELDKNLKQLSASKRSLMAFIEKNGENPQDSYVANDLSILANTTGQLLGSFCRDSFLVTYGTPKKRDDEGNIVPLDYETTPEFLAKQKPMKISSFSEDSIFSKTGNAQVSDDSLRELLSLLGNVDKQVIPSL